MFTYVHTLCNTTRWNNPCTHPLTIGHWNKTADAAEIYKRSIHPGPSRSSEWRQQRVPSTETWLPSTEADGHWSCDSHVHKRVLHVSRSVRPVSRVWYMISLWLLLCTSLHLLHVLHAPRRPHIHHQSRISSYSVHHAECHKRRR